LREELDEASFQANQPTFTATVARTGEHVSAPDVLDVDININRDNGEEL
jgi:hypothetical protein